MKKKEGIKDDNMADIGAQDKGKLDDNKHANPDTDPTFK
jgi:hypothetical protein